MDVVEMDGIWGGRGGGGGGGETKEKRGGKMGEERFAATVGRR